MLLGMLVAGLMHAFLPRDLVRRQFTGLTGVLKAVLLGIPLPLCSCGVIPAGIGLHKDGASDGASVGFLISTPQTGVDSIFVSASFLGWPFAIFKVLSALVTGLVGGWATEIWGGTRPGQRVEEAVSPGAQEHWLKEMTIHAVDIFRSIWIWILVGVLASAALTVWTPDTVFSSANEHGVLWSTLIVLVISIPLYVCSTASVPIAAALVAGGFPPGAALVFLMAGPATNLATLGAIFKAFGGRVTTIYLLTIAVGSVALGLGFEMLLDAGSVSMNDHEHPGGIFPLICAVLLSGLMLWFAVERVVEQTRVRGTGGAGAQILSVEGMTCQGCVRKLEASLKDLEGIEDLSVQLTPGSVSYSGTVDEAVVRDAIHKTGFSVIPDE
jgi:hypothetical protein